MRLTFGNLLIAIIILYRRTPASHSSRTALDVLEYINFNLFQQFAMNPMT